jgi:hypothetical protein
MIDFKVKFGGEMNKIKLSVTKFSATAKSIGLTCITGATIALIAPTAQAQVSINSNGVVAGTVVPPNRNPTFNQGTTRIDTDSQGRYFRNGELIFNAQDINPNLVGVTSSGRYYVDFRGIPLVSVDGSLTSPVLNGQLRSVQRFNHNVPVTFWGNVQDEFVVQGQFTGTATDPTTGNQYQGTFNIRGQGPRYSDRNGGTSPTVFDFKSYYNFRANPQILPTPTVSSYNFQAMPVRLVITIPAGLQPIAPSSPNQPIAPIQPPSAPIAPNNPDSNPIFQPIVPPSNPISPSTPISANPPVNPDPSINTLVPNQAFFEVNRVVLESQKARPIGPRSRIILR